MSVTNFLSLDDLYELSFIITNVSLYHWRLLSPIKKVNFYTLSSSTEDLLSCRQYFKIYQHMLQVLTELLVQMSTTYILQVLMNFGPRKICHVMVIQRVNICKNRNGYKFHLVMSKTNFEITNEIIFVHSFS